MKSNRSTLAAGALRFVRLLAFCIPTMMLLNAASANEPPTAGASKIPGAKGTIEYKPEGWKGTGVTTYWKDSNGIKPGVAGCHVEVTKSGKSFPGISGRPVKMGSWWNRIRVVTSFTLTRTISGIPTPLTATHGVSVRGKPKQDSA